MIYIARPDPLFNGCCIFCCFHPLHLQKSGQNQFGFILFWNVSLKRTDRENKWFDKDLSALQSFVQQFFPQTLVILEADFLVTTLKKKLDQLLVCQCSTSDHLIFKHSPEMIFKPLPEMKFKDTWVSLLSWRFVKQFQTKHLRVIWCFDLFFIWLNLVVLEHLILIYPSCISPRQKY